MIHASVCYRASIPLTEMKFPHLPCRNIRFIFYVFHCTDIKVIAKDLEIKAQFVETEVQWEKCFICFLESP